MSNPTTPFSWQMPTNADLVTDLPADFEVFGQAVATSMQDLLGGTTGQVLAKASNTDMDFVWSADAAGMTNPMTTTGDSIYSSSGSTPARLGIGSAGQVLTVASGLPSWATPASGLTKITSGSFSNAATVDIDTVFSVSYLNYFVVIQVYGNTSSTNYFKLQWRYGSSTETGNLYQYSGQRITSNNTTTAMGGVNQPDAVLSFNVGGTNNPTRVALNISGVGQSGAAEAAYHGTLFDNYAQGVCYIGGISTQIRNYTGFRLLTGATNITGTYAVYGLAN